MSQVQTRGVTVSPRRTEILPALAAKASQSFGAAIVLQAEKLAIADQ